MNCFVPKEPYYAFFAKRSINDCIYVLELLLIKSPTIKIKNAKGITAFDMAFNLGTENKIAKIMQFWSCWWVDKEHIGEEEKDRAEYFTYWMPHELIVDMFSIFKSSINGDSYGDGVVKISRTLL